MIKFFSSAVFLFLFTNGFSQGNTGTGMFRDNSYVPDPRDLIYDTRAWQFNAGSPVRATPLTGGSNLYAGTAAGVFYALDKKSGSVKWKYQSGAAIHSSAARQNGKVYFSDNSQSVYCLNESNGKLLWKMKMGAKRAYPWRYDYHYSSPVLHGGKLLIGGDDGNFYALHPATGKIIWQFNAKGIIRSTAAVYKDNIIFGDSEATLYALDIKNGKEVWQYRINGDTMNNDDYGFDRRAINASPVVRGNKVIVGARDGFLYCVDADKGKTIWKMDHLVSWVNTTVAVRDSFVITGTSDGRFVQAIHLETGREIWKFKTAAAVWSSPLIVNNTVYAGTFDGQLYCIDLYSGRRISQVRVNGKILSSPVWDDDLLYTGADDGYIYALSGHADRRLHKDNVERYVYYEPGIAIYFRAGSDMVLRNYLRGNGYKVIGSDSLAWVMSKAEKAGSVIVFATCWFPPGIAESGNKSIIRQYLDGGGRIVLTGTNPLLYKIDEKNRQPAAFRPGAIDTILGLDYGKGDTRTFMGDFPCFASDAGIQLGLPDFWYNSVFIQQKNVDVVLGRNENGEVSAFTKNYSNGGCLVQLWLDPDRPDRLDAVIKAAEWELRE